MTNSARAWLFAIMFEAEAARLREILLEQASVSPLLDLGSSDVRFRQTIKPHIDKELFAPLRAAGIEVLHADVRNAPGVDFVGDVLDPAFRERLRARHFRCVLVANLLEHVRDPASLAAACEEIVGRGGLILASAPASHPYHADPVDTHYRPAAAELARLFARSTPLRVEEVSGDTYAEQIRAHGSSLAAELALTFLWVLAFPVRPKSARARLSRWRWYRRRYRASLALVRVTGTPARTES